MIEKIPMLPDTVQKVEEAYNNQNGTLKDLSDAIKGDPITTAFILKTANSPFYGLSRTVSDIEHAVSLLGKDAIRTFAIANAANSCLDFDLSPYGINFDTYMKKAQMQNALVTKWVSKVDKNLLKHLSIASFLLELGKVIISKYLISNKLSAALATALNASETIQEAEVKAVGAKSEDITASLFFKWHFDPDLVHLVRYANDPKDALDEDTMAMAKFLKVAKESLTIDGNITEDTLSKARELLKEYELDEEPFNNTVKALMEVA
jgi:HD-like signal output (HDOD) protein